MTLAQRWPLQKAIHARLVARLAGQGIDGADVPVFDHVPFEPPRLHVRLDGFTVTPGPASNGHRARHEFRVHVFDDNTGPATGAGSREVAGLCPIVVGALADWSPLTGATGITHIATTSAAHTDPLSAHALSRFFTHIGA